MYKISDGTEFVGKTLIFLPKCHSTNDIAADLYQRGIIPPGAVVITDQQLAGKGQRGNKWESAAGKNLTFSLVLEPNFLGADESFYLNIAASLALSDTLLKLSDSFTVKWPNDLYYRHKKIGGILIENHISGEKITSSVIGIGLNINQVRFVGLPDAVSLRQIFSRFFDLNEILHQVLQSLEDRWLALNQFQFEAMKLEYLRRLYGYRQVLRFKVGSQITEGLVEGIDSVGRLVVQMGGAQKKFNFQEIIFLN